MRILTSQEFKEKMLDAVLNRGKTDLSSISSSVKKIITDVRENGDEALLLYTEKFDNVRLTKSKLKVTKKEIEKSYEKLETEQINALKKAALNITRFHESQIRNAWSLETTKGVTVGQVTRPLSSVGVYTPRGEASYPSSVLMCAIPAKIVGIKKIIVCSPPRKNGYTNPALLVAADIAGVTEIYRVGGAQAIAAMAYGTETVPKVDKIIGPGNVFVTAAKLEVSKDVAIDIPAGPSEVLIIADETANASFVAADLLAQAEHDPRAWAILLTTSKDLALAVEKEVRKQWESLSRKETVKSSMQTGGLIVLIKNLEEAVDYANLIAPEHLQILTRTPRKVFDKIQSAGAVFLGQYSPVAFGDYSAGLNHVLPTGGYAKSYSGLSTRDFVKTINFLECSKKGYLSLERMTVTLAKLEGFNGHTRSVSIRGDKSEN
ncbi:MAG: bifunctional histidinal dehydrogenase/ histidinol dehydrogenase [Candidatus Bathyarchaeota archaeon BA2]|nr:MAG: bifunctional histidinal dehydrogenase/ histidinol dehydrogenase [Candidatus Bathyarchaeota archaeon BA2]